MSLFQKIYLILFCILLFVIPFTDKIGAIPNIILICLTIIFPFTIKKNEFRNFFTKDVIVLGSFCVFLFLEAILYSRMGDIKYVSKLFLLFAYVFLGQVPIIKENTNKLLCSFVSGTFFLLLCSIVVISIDYFKSGNLNFSVGSKINGLLLGDRPYVAFCYTISFFITIYKLRKSMGSKEKFGWILLSVSFLGFLIFISARTSLLSILIAGMISIFFLRNIKVKLSVLILTFIFALSSVFLNKNFKDRLTLGFDQHNFSMERVVKFEPRFHIWSCAKLIIDNNPITYFGFGFINTQERLNSCYEYNHAFLNQSHKEWFVYKSFNTHNQYLNFYLSTGLFGLICFFSICFLLVLKYRKKLISLVMIVSMLLFFMFENVLTRQMGIELCALILIFSLQIGNFNSIFNRRFFDKI